MDVGNKSIRLAVIASLAIFTLGEAQAARLKFKVGSGLSSVGRSIKTYPSTTLSPARLKDCVEREHNIGKVEDSRKLIHSLIEQKQNELIKEQSHIEFISLSIDERKKSAVQEFNKKVDLFNIERKKLNESIKVFNEGRASFEKQIDKFNNECAGKQYYKDDLLAARKELGLPLND